MPLHSQEKAELLALNFVRPLPCPAVAVAPKPGLYRKENHRESVRWCAGILLQPLDTGPGRHIARPVQHELPRTPDRVRSRPLVPPRLLRRCAPELTCQLAGMLG